METPETVQGLSKVQSRWINPRPLSLRMVNGDRDPKIFLFVVSETFLVRDFWVPLVINVVGSKLHYI